MTGHEDILRPKECHWPKRCALTTLWFVHGCVRTCGYSITFDQRNVCVEQRPPFLALGSHQSLVAFCTENVVVQISYPPTTGNRHVEIFHAIIEVH